MLRLLLFIIIIIILLFIILYLITKMINYQDIIGTYIIFTVFYNEYTYLYSLE